MVGFVVLFLGDELSLFKSEDFLVESELVFVAVEFEVFEVEFSFLSWDLIVGVEPSDVDLMSLVLFLVESEGRLISLVWFLIEPVIDLLTLVVFFKEDSLVEVVFFLITGSSSSSTSNIDLLPPKLFGWYAEMNVEHKKTKRSSSKNSTFFRLKPWSGAICTEI